MQSLVIGDLLRTSEVKQMAVFAFWGIFGPQNMQSLVIVDTQMTFWAIWGKN